MPAGSLWNRGAGEWQKLCFATWGSDGNRFFGFQDRCHQQIDFLHFLFVELSLRRSRQPKIEAGLFDSMLEHTDVIGVIFARPVILDRQQDLL